MENYKLAEDEVCLCETDAYDEQAKQNCDILLTNKYLLLTYSKQRLFRPTEYRTTRYSVNDVKYFNGEPQVKIKKRVVEVYFKNSEVKLNFDSKWFGTENALYNAFIKFLSGKNLAERGADKFKGAIKLVDDTLGIDTLGAARSAVENTTGVSLTSQSNNSSIGVSSSGNGTIVGGKIGLIAQALDIAKSIIPNKKEKAGTVEDNKSLSNDKIETLKKLKELVDMGILTQEEFETKKKELI